MANTIEYWDLWYPEAGSTGMSFARGQCAPTQVMLVHAAPPLVSVTVRDAEGRVLAQSERLHAAGDTPIAKLTRQGDHLTRANIWPTASDLGLPVLLPGGEIGILKHWWNAPDQSEWRWQIELHNHR